MANLLSWNPTHSKISMKCHILGHIPVNKITGQGFVVQWGDTAITNLYIWGKCFRGDEQGTMGMKGRSGQRSERSRECFSKAALSELGRHGLKVSRLTAGDRGVSDSGYFRQWVACAQWEGKKKHGLMRGYCSASEQLEHSKWGRWQMRLHPQRPCLPS